MMRASLIPALLLVAACNPMMDNGLNFATLLHHHDELEDLEVENERDRFDLYAKGVHEYKGDLTYDWVNTGDGATVITQEKSRGCSDRGSEMIVTVYDAKGEVVYTRTVRNFKDQKFRYEDSSLTGQPGVWRINVKFNRNSSFHKLRIILKRVGDPLLIVEQDPGSWTWSMPSTDDRDVIEEHEFDDDDGQAWVSCDHTDDPDGSLTVDVFDDDGDDVGHFVCDPTRPHIDRSPTLAGAPGTWTVRLTFDDFDSTDTCVTVED